MADYLWSVTRRRRVRIKQLLMNSHLVVGVGNIYANEALFRARIRPQRKGAQPVTRRGGAPGAGRAHGCCARRFASAVRPCVTMSEPMAQRDILARSTSSTSAPANPAGSAERSCAISNQGQRSELLLPNLPKNSTGMSKRIVNAPLALRRRAGRGSLQRPVLIAWSRSWNATLFRALATRHLAPATAWPMPQTPF